jgi:hypothetical protein
MHIHIPCSIGMFTLLFLVFLGLPLYSSVLLYLLCLLRMSLISLSIYMSNPSELCMMAKR